MKSQGNKNKLTEQGEPVWGKRWGKKRRNFLFPQRKSNINKRMTEMKRHGVSYYIGEPNQKNQLGGGKSIRACYQENTTFWEAFSKTGGGEKIPAMVPL